MDKNHEKRFHSIIYFSVAKIQKCKKASENDTILIIFTPDGQKNFAIFARIAKSRGTLVVESRKLLGFDDMIFAKMPTNDYAIQGRKRSKIGQQSSSQVEMH